jgi:hypothetical protein
MNSDHFEAWRDYLVEQMQGQYGVAKGEAQKTVSRWLRRRRSRFPKRRESEIGDLRESTFPNQTLSKSASQT